MEGNSNLSKIGFTIESVQIYNVAGIWLFVRGKALYFHYCFWCTSLYGYIIFDSSSRYFPSFINVNYEINF